MVALLKFVSSKPDIANSCVDKKLGLLPAKAVSHVIVVLMLKNA